MSNMRQKARKKAEKDMNRGENFNLAIPEGTQFFAPKSKGPYNLDILPYEVTVDTHPEVNKGELWYQRTYWKHFGLGDDGKKSTICPKTIGKPCPICEMYKELNSSDDEDDRESAKKIKAKERELYNVIDLDNQDAGIQIFEYSFHLFGKALSEEINEGPEEYAGFAELEDGYTLQVHFRKTSIGGGTPFYELRKLEFEEREEYDEEILEEVYNLDQLLKISSYKELQSMLTGTEEEDTDKEEEEKPKKSSKEKSSKPSSKKKKSDENEDEDSSSKKSSSKRPGKVSDKKKSKDKNKCPGDGTFGEDTDELKACKKCDVWTDCQEAYEAKYGSDENEEE